MKLKSIKLAGFKSFVDPTELRFTCDIAGIVGPNGCGKSNVIDAVRWVMGESSAKQLRGESMSDVIFNGSAGRKPVGQASVELVFDNSHGQFGGEYEKYHEISARRTVNRDGVSTYYFNHARCRRRDIGAVFAGTGIAQGRYAIVEQGMITRLVEAKPDELRAHIEEVANIAIFKERKKETDGRIARSRENMAQLDYLRDELGKQLEKLQAQSRAAERYQALKQEERTLSEQWHVLQDSQLQEAMDRLALQIAEAKLQCASCENQLQANDAEQNKLRDEQQARQEHSQEQFQYHAQLGADIARLEQSLSDTKRSINECSDQRKKMDEMLEQAASRQTEDQASLLQVEEALLQIQPRQERLAEQCEQQDALMQKAQQELAQAKEQWQIQVSRQSETTQKIELLQRDIAHWEHQQQDDERRVKRLDLESQEFNDQGLERDIAEHKLRAKSSTLALKSEQEVLARLEKQQLELREELKACEAALPNIQRECERLLQMTSALDAQQQLALGRVDNPAGSWLDEQQLAKHQRLAETLEVESRWRLAVQHVLSSWLDAVMLTDGMPGLDALSRFQHGDVTLLTSESHAWTPRSLGQPLYQKIHSQGVCSSWLYGIYCAESMEAAMAAQRELRPGESFVTPEGDWLGPNWLRLWREHEHEQGILERGEELIKLTEALKLAQKSRDEHLNALEAVRAQLEAMRPEEQRARQALGALRLEESQATATLQHLEQKLIEQKARVLHLTQERHELALRMQTMQQKMSVTRSELEELIAALEVLHRAAETVVQSKSQAEATYAQELQHTERLKKEAQQLTLEDQRLRDRQSSLRVALGRAEDLASEYQDRKVQLSQKIDELQQVIPTQTAHLDALLAKKLDADQSRKVATDKLNELNETLRKLSHQQNQTQQQLNHHTAELSQLQVKMAGHQSKQESLAGWFESHPNVNRDDVLRQISSDVTPESLQKAIDQCQERISRLGAVNLTAVQELAVERERKERLDQQHQDLMEALATLEAAMQQIEQETQSRFRAAFDGVNANFSRLFSQVFSGGEAKLVATSDCWLTTGVNIVAKPPGKRNTSIHLLSGGEKTLAALALVFALFELSPAPFCLLDEVDAPLDEVNVARFCQLVQKMAERVQFIMITHNKLTMEMAAQLSGITMKEPGVSRVVSVDVETSKQWAQ